MPVTHGVASSSLVQTAKSLGEIQGFFVLNPQITVVNGDSHIVIVYACNFLCAYPCAYILFISDFDLTEKEHRFRWERGV